MMAAALIRRGTGLCCIHRELCRVVWRSQTALFSSKPSDKNQPRKTHIKKAKPKPAVDVAKLLEEIFSQQRPGTAPPAGKEMVVVGSVDVDTAAEVTDDVPAQKEVLLKEEFKEEEGAQAEALGSEDVKGTHADLDPVQRLFLEKIREYNNMRRLNGGLLEAEPGSEKLLSEETAKLQRLYGGGDLSSFPQFTFTEPETDQDSK